MTRLNFVLGSLIASLSICLMVLGFVLLPAGDNAAAKGSAAAAATMTPSPLGTGTPSAQTAVTSGSSGGSVAVTRTTYFSPDSIWNTRIPSNAIYTRDNRIGSFRQMGEEWSVPVYRIAADQTYPLVEVKNIYSDRVEHWPIPTFALPATASDHHLAVIYTSQNIVYEMWNAQWVDATHIKAGGMASFPLNGTGISDPPNQRVDAAGFSNLGGMILHEDFLNPSTGKYDPNSVIAHALSMALPGGVLSTGYVAPAVGGEDSGSAGEDGIPMGALFALPKDLNVDYLDVQPFTKAILRAARDYGIYVNDGNGTPPYNDTAIGTIRLEPGLYEAVFGMPGDVAIWEVQDEVYSVIAQYGIYRITTAQAR